MIAEDTPQKGLGEEHNDDTQIPGSAERKNYLIAIGIDDYNDPNLNLLSCVKDCKDLAQVLTDKYNFNLFDKILVNQDATKVNIKKLFKAFIADPFYNNDRSNLVVFYSGHGHIIELAEDDKIGCWLPAGGDHCSTDPEEFFSIDDLLLLLRQIKTKHIVVISDACYSAKLVEQSQLFRLSAASENSKNAFDDEPSRWAICAGRSNEEVAAGGQRENSRFSNVLLMKLKENVDEILRLKTLIDRIEGEFVEDVFQKPYAGILNITGRNSGQLILRANVDMVMSQKRKKLLDTSLLTLNYESQRTSVSYRPDRPSHLLTCASGTKDHGLRFLVHLLKQSHRKIVRGSPAFPYEPSYSGGSQEPSVVELFNTCLPLRHNGPPLKDEDAVRKALLDYLKNKPLIIELKFYNERLSPNVKSKLLNDISRFISPINVRPDVQHPVIIYVLDYDDQDYSTLVSPTAFSGITTVILPPIDYMDERKLSEWYENEAFRNQEFEVLFEDIICNKTDILIRESEGKPGRLISCIYERSGCYDFAIQLLEF